MSQNKIHCFSCGRDGVTDEIKQATEKPIRRCAHCFSTNFRVLEEEGNVPTEERPKVVQEEA